MSIPLFNENGELPDGEYIVSLEEIENRFGGANQQRRWLMQGLKAAAANLGNANVRKLWIDGSFITDKENPNDIDGVWETNQKIDLNVLDPVFLGSRRNMAWISFLMLLRPGVVCHSRNFLEPIEINNPKVSWWYDSENNP